MIDDYNKYKYKKSEWIQYFIQGALIGITMGFLFYSNILACIVMTPYGFLHAHNMKKQLIKQRRWELNLEFRDGLASISAAMNAGYSVENAFKQAVSDLKLMYSCDALIVVEFEGIVNQIQMNQTVEDILKDFAERSGVEDIANFAEVFITAKRTGGDIIKIIRSTGNTIGDKIEIKREIITMISGKRFEANIMNMIPFSIIIYLKVFSPGFLDALYNNWFGVVFMTVILILYYAIYKLAENIINIEV